MSAYSAVFGLPPRDLVALAGTLAQFSPLVAGSARLEEMPPQGLENIAVLAPPGTIERQYVLALALRSLKPNAPMLALAPNDKGGARIAAELRAFGCETQSASKYHHRIVTTTRPASPSGLDAAIAAGAPRLDAGLGLWTQPGVFSWNRIDPGSALLLDHLLPLSGQGADLGCGLGVLGRAILVSDRVARLELVDNDRRAIDMAERNVEDKRAHFHWADARHIDLGEKLDFIVMNPPFHDGGAEDRELGKAFISTAARALRKGGTLWLVANRHLPYEAVLRAQFAGVQALADHGGFKVLKAVR